LSLVIPIPYEFDPKIGILNVNNYTRQCVIVAMKKLATPWDTKAPHVLDTGVGRKTLTRHTSRFIPGEGASSVNRKRLHSAVWSLW